MDLEYGSPRVKGYDEGANQRASEDSLDQLDEARTVAMMHSARYQQALRWYQTRKIRHRYFDEGDLVLRLRKDNRGRHKLSPPWEGPYVIVKMLKPSTYKLANEDGEELTNAWNIQRLPRPLAHLEGGDLQLFQLLLWRVVCRLDGLLLGHRVPKSGPQA
jgi:hypothetical protein